jgi:hypothetical protein
MEIPITPEQFAALQKRAGIAADVTSGMVDQQGVTAHWAYEERPPDGGVLVGTILKKPSRLVPDSFIWSRFRKWAGL